MDRAESTFRRYCGVTTNKQPWIYLGGKTTFIRGLDDADTGYADWSAQVAGFVSRLAETPDFQVKDNGYRRYPGVLVTNGITATFRGKSFQIWSDIAGEIILLHGSMGHRLARQLIDRLGAEWANHSP